MIRVGVSHFREHLMGYLNKIDNGEVIELTVRGKNIAKIVPPDNKTKEAREKLHEISKTSFIGDIVSPIDDEWKAST